MIGLGRLEILDACFFFQLWGSFNSKPFQLKETKKEGETEEKSEEKNEEDDEEDFSDDSWDADEEFRKMFPKKKRPGCKYAVFEVFVQ